MSKKLTHEAFVDQLRIRNDHYRNGEFEVVGSYANYHTKIECKCLKSEKHSNWFTVPYSLFKNCTCPKCAKENMANTKKEKRKNSSDTFGDKFPNIAKEWDYERNGKVKPNDFAPNSPKKVWWICNNGHRWETSISHRARGESCPYCSNHKILKGFNDFASNNEDLLKEWDFDKNTISPYEIASKSNKKVWWKCSKCGCSWNTSPSNRLEGTGCPNCNSSGTSYPEQVIYYYVKKSFPNALNRYKFSNVEFDIYIPSIKVAIEYDGVAFHKGKENKDNIKDEFCLNNEITLYRIREYGLGVTKSATNIFREKNISNKSLEKCIVELFSKLEINQNVKVDLDFTNIMDQYYESERENSLESKCPSLINEWNHERNGNLLPNRVSNTSHLKVWWKCSKCGNEWQSTIASRTNTNNGCPYCSGRNAIPGVNDIVTLMPNLAKEWNNEKNGDMLPQNFKVGSGKRVWWKCSKCGGEWEAIIGSRSKGNGCPYCANYKVLKGKNDLATTYPQIAIDWHPTKNGDMLPSDVTKGSSKRVWWKCHICGYEWNAPIKDRTRGRGCTKCVNEKRNRNN